MAKVLMRLDAKLISIEFIHCGLSQKMEFTLAEFQSADYY